ncbi:cupredoxin domain-containing protein [Hoyosella rhizosphaerae]|uniref:Blue (type 1) copper domain-containing protein n=1 Tax=Hoyosella rhizosphaerae TaxID=1755582 RepID=A0A916UDQ4_9ACTN|nr:plastocyanin/azurin family copper-binding protein [Hoyosella rhizosphaerae]MBN4925646.1 cupredoxin domain-containing protein [Hoyosella rhizosphaerae]GGC69014.1 hypothetical protein GCM10011410_22290 [Hoyosella rhizosphaerae]
MVIKTTRTLVAAAAVLVMGAATACGTDTDETEQPAPIETTETATEAPDDDVDADSAAATVEVTGFSFEPSTVTVSVGDTVEWVFGHGQTPHNVVGRDGAPDDFRSPTLREETWSYTFTEAGEYNYICSIHPQMQGTVVVE